MTKKEYEDLQLRLSLKLDYCLYTGNRKQIYREAILSAKSVLHDFYIHQEKKEK